MRRAFTLAVFLLACVSAPCAQAAERILSFHSDISIHLDGKMTVTETIRVWAEGVQIKRGIYRDFPTRYRSPSGNNVEVDFQVVSVTRDGNPEKYRSELRSNGVRTYIGSKDVYLRPGEYTYVLTYTSDRQLGFFKDHDELFWNVTGNGWSFTIDSASASVGLPGRALNQVMEIDGYTGMQGETGKDFRTGRDEDGRLTFQTTRPLRVHEGLTILVTWPKGYVLEPTLAQRLGYFLKDNRGVAVGLVGLLGLFLFFFLTWNRVGRDPAKGVIIPLFYPPKGFSPAALRFLMKMGFDDKILACAVIDMAVRGHLTISEGRGGATVLTKTGREKERLSPEEEALSKQFFRSSPALELKTVNHSAISSGISQLKKVLSQNIEKIYFVTNQRFFLTGLFASLAVIGVSAALQARQPAMMLFMSLWLPIWTLGTWALVVALVREWQKALKGRGSAGKAVFMTFFSLPFIAGELFGIGVFCWAASVGAMLVCLAVVIMDVVFYRLLKAPTMQGRGVMDQVEGFKMYLAVAEKDRLRMLGGPAETTELFEKYLPYALALDVEQEWAEKFSDLLNRASQEGRNYQPTWYTGTMWAAGGYTGFASGLASSLASTITSSSVAPGSSSGSSFGGGGGSSGGGGGGGGGGGW